MDLAAYVFSFRRMNVCANRGELYLSTDSEEGRSRRFYANRNKMLIKSATGEA